MSGSRAISRRRGTRAPRILIAVLTLLGAIAVACGQAGENAAGGPKSTVSPGGPDGLRTSGATTTIAAPTGPSDPEGARTAVYPGYVSEVHNGTEHWLCHPDLPTDPCRRHLGTTVVSASGARHVVTSEPAADPPVDCFFVHGVVSLDKGTNSDLTPDDPERLTARAQAAQFSRVCRVFVPAFRGVTVPYIDTEFADNQPHELEYRDVIDAWKTYVSQDNHGRGVVLIGHSNGANILLRLLKAEVDDNPVLRRRLVSAILLGTTVLAPDGQDVGGDLRQIPACRMAGQTGCLITYSSYPADRLPGPDGIFGRSAAGERALCVNPVSLAGGDRRADATLAIDAPFTVGRVVNDASIRTPFVSYPGVLQATCERKGAYDVLAFAPARAGDARPVDDLLRERLGEPWGLHLFDMNLVQENLIRIVARQSSAYGR